MLLEMIKLIQKKIIKNKYKKIVISPGQGNSNQSGNCLKIVKDLHKDPNAGVCLGHQVIGQVFGGKIEVSKNLMHGKMSKIIHKKLGLFKNFKSNFQATRYHSLIIGTEKSYLKCLIITAETKNKTIMGIMHENIIFMESNFILKVLIQK